MFRKSSARIALVALAGMVALLGVTPASADAGAGVGPAQAMAITDDWQKLDVGATTWYAFDYLGDSSQILVLMQAVPASGANFTVWTPEQVADYAAGKAVQPVGAGGKNEYGPATHIWSGNFNMPGRYYVVVTQSGQEPVYYTIQATGSGVMRLPAVGAASAAPTTTAASSTSTVAAAAESVAMDGSTPGEALAIPAYDVPIAADASLWHAFHYAGNQSQIQVWLDVQGQSGFSFDVFTPEQMQAIEQGQSSAAVGSGSHDVYAAGDLTWSGSFPPAGVYYVKVTNANPYATTYTLQISGSGVW